MGTGSEQFHGLPVRADIANALVAEGVTFLRYGGTMINVPGYRWKNMIGDPDKRPPYTGNWYPYSTNGFGIFDFLNFCEAAHIQPAFAINIEESAQDCADLADYLTAPITSPWGRRRAADGHRPPYQVHFIEIGNEESLGGDDPAAYRHYAERFRAIAQAIHGRSPKLKLVCAAWWRPYSPNMEQVFRAVDGEAAAWDLHVWADAPRSGDSTGAGPNAAAVPNVESSDDPEGRHLRGKRRPAQSPACAWSCRHDQCRPNLQRFSLGGLRRELSPALASERQWLGPGPDILHAGPYLGHAAVLCPADDGADL